MCNVAGRLLDKHGVEYVHIDAEDSPELCKIYNVKSVPFLVCADSIGSDAKYVCRTPQSEAALVEFLSMV